MHGRMWRCWYVRWCCSRGRWPDSKTGFSRPILICNNVAVCWPFCSECTLTTAKHTHKCAKLCLTIFRVVHCCWSPLVYIFVSFIFYIYMFSITAAKFCFSSRTCVLNSIVVSHMCGTHKNQLVFGARSGIWNDCAARGDKVSVNAAYAQHCVRVHRSKQTTHTHTKWPVFLWVPSVTTLRNVFNVLYFFVVVIFLLLHRCTINVRCRCSMYTRHTRKLLTGAWMMTGWMDLDGSIKFACFYFLFFLSRSLALSPSLTLFILLAQRKTCTSLQIASNAKSVKKQKYADRENRMNRHTHARTLHQQQYSLFIHFFSLRRR